MAVQGNRKNASQAAISKRGPAHLLVTAPLTLTVFLQRLRPRQLGHLDALDTALLIDGVKVSLQTGPIRSNGFRRSCAVVSQREDADASITET